MTRIQDHSAPLCELLDGIDYRVFSQGKTEGLATVVSGISDDSRQVGNGSLFVAVSGMVTDGHSYIGEVAKNGCPVIMAEKGADYSLPKEWDGCLLEVSDSRKAYGTLAENWFGKPAQSMTLIGVTGTNGKTTITYLLEDILLSRGCQVGVIGTVNYRYNSDSGRMVIPSPFTTPEAARLQGLLAEMKENGVEYVIMEVSSHALSQHRIGNIMFDVAAFTNLSRDHLDYHKSMEEYFQAKAMLFANHLKQDGTAVLSTPLQDKGDDDWAGRLVGLCNKRGIRVVCSGGGETSDAKLLDYYSALTATKIKFRVSGQVCELESPLVGHFNVDNTLTAVAMAVAAGIEPVDIVTALAEAKGAPGRLQRVTADDGSGNENPVVFVDYAHTPDALKQVLTTLAALPHRELYCVFGCGGDRDAGKRPAMGSFAGCFADVAIITDDNPRNEDSDDIRRQIVPGVVKAGLDARSAKWLENRPEGERGFVEIGSRKEAIHQTICAAGPGDIVLIAGKGHENYQITPDGKQFFDDCLEAQDALLSWNCSSLTQATAGDLYKGTGDMRCLGNISTDSRSISPGDVFVALKGEKFDAHEFLDAVQEKGAGCLIVEKGRIPESVTIPVIEVADTLQALGDLAAYRRKVIRQLADQKVVAITGSCGKTTVKEMTAAILRRKWPGGVQFPENVVLQTRGNLNNLIGLPLSLLPLSVANRAAVLELGMNVPGEIKRMTAIADPDICCITNVHGVHLEGLGSIDGVADAKEELLHEANDNAAFIVNLDDEHVRTRAEKYSQKKITFTAEEQNRVDSDLWVTEIESGDAAKMIFTLHRADQEARIELHTAGSHNISNALAAAAIATAAGATLDEIALGLSDFRPADRRMVIEEGPEGISIINDTYNANPVSMVAAIRTLKELSQNRCMAVLGDMLELGDTAAQLHRELGAQVGKANLDYLAVVGEFREHIVEGARENGMSEAAIQSFAKKEQVVSWIEDLVNQGNLGQDDWILVKASRGLQMETIVRALTGE